VGTLEADDAQIKEILSHLKSICKREAIQVMHYMSDAVARSVDDTTSNILMINKLHDKLDPTDLAPTQIIQANRAST
jgi:hypothetical protein